MKAAVLRAPKVLEVGDIATPEAAMTKSSLTVRSCPYGVENIAATGISNNAEIVPVVTTTMKVHSASRV